jgi:hypothetical protein
MIASLAAIFGALTGLVPAVLQFFTLRANNAQALELKKLELQAAKEGVALQIDLANVQADIQQQQHIYDFANSPTGIKWVDAFSTIVRPYITMFIFHLWVLIEVGLFVAAVNGGLDLAQIVPIIWDDTTKATFASILGFWFGNRSGDRAGQRMAATLSVTNPSVQAAPGAKPPGFIATPAGDRS